MGWSESMGRRGEASPARGGRNARGGQDSRGGRWGRAWLAATGVAVAVVVLLGLTLALRLSGPGEPDGAAAQRGGAEPRRAIRPRLRSEESRTVRRPETAKAAPRPENGAKAEEWVPTPGKLRLPDGRVLTFPVPREGEFRIVHSHGRTYKCDHLGNFEDVTPKPVFDNAFEENLIGVSVEGGGFVPGMLLGLDRDEVLRMLNRPVTVNDDDPEDVKAKKRAVAETKELILEYMKGGGTFDECVMELRELSVRERGARGTALRDIVALLKEGRAEDAALYRRTVDARLEKEGLRPLRLPGHIAEALGGSGRAGGGEQQPHGGEEEGQ
ncbi:MAG: hypothetical protein ACI4RA_10580 [Kiritimatiellia bacterium]